MTKITKETYTSFIRNTIREHGFEIANDVNHRALELKLISLELFLTAADIIAQIIINR